MNDIKFTKTNGGMGRKAANEDPISGLLMYLREVKPTDLTGIGLPRVFDDIAIEYQNDTGTLYVAELNYAEELDNYCIKESPLSTDANDYDSGGEVSGFKRIAAFNTIVYHVKEFFRMNPEGTLYLGINISGNIQIEDVEAIQNYANGKIRQLGVFDSEYAAHIKDYQTAASGLEKEHKPLSIIGTQSGQTMEVSLDSDELSVESRSVDVSLADLTTTTDVAEGRCNVSYLVGCDLDPAVVAQLGHYAYYGCIGTCLGAVSKAAVHECIAWVGNFPLGLGMPGLIGGELIKEVHDGDLNKVNKNHYIFVRTHVGNADNFFNDSHTLDVDTSDYAFIENVRTIDKACRGVRANLLPYLNSPLKVDAETGKLDAPMVAFLETTAGKALEDMEKAGELSGYRAEIDPDQNVLATSQVEVLIKNVPMGVMRKVHVKIGFTSSL